MVTPFVILVVYWLGIVGALYLGISQIARGMRFDSFSEVLVGFLFLVLGPVYVRVMCELIILAFKMLDELRAVRSALTSAVSASDPASPQQP